MDLAVVTGADLDQVDGRLHARPGGPGRLHLCVNQGAEIHRAGPDGVRLVHRRAATGAEDAALDRAARATVTALAERGLRATVLTRANQRRIEVVPGGGPAGPHSRALAGCRSDRLPGEAADLAAEAARRSGVVDPRVTSDGTFIEIGLTDGADAVRWLLDDLRGRGVGSGLVLFVGTRPVPDAARATVVSVAGEPAGTPVLALGGGPRRFRAILADQLLRRRRGDVPEIDGDPAWTIPVDGLDPDLERVHEALLTIADGRLGTRAAPLLAHP